MSSFPCPKCKEPVDGFEYVGGGKCWHCGWNTASYEEDHSKDALPYYNSLEKFLDKNYQFTPDLKKLTGLSSSYYELPNGCKELQDLIEYKNMNFARGNIFKATYRLGDKPGTDQIYDYEKIIWFAQREIERLKNAEKSAD